MATQWVPLRISAETEAALQRVRESMGRAYENGQIMVGPGEKGTIPLYRVVDYLVCHYQRHRERRQKHQRKAAERKRQCRARTTTSSQADTQATQSSSAPCGSATSVDQEREVQPSPTMYSPAGAALCGQVPLDQKAG